MSGNPRTCPQTLARPPVDPLWGELGTADLLSNGAALFGDCWYAPRKCSGVECQTAVKSGRLDDAVGGPGGSPALLHAGEWHGHSLDFAHRVHPLPRHTPVHDRAVSAADVLVVYLGFQRHIHIGLVMGSVK